MTPQMQCDRCYWVGSVTWDDEQGFLCSTCLTQFESERAKEAADKAAEYDRAPYYPQDY